MRQRIGKRGASIQRVEPGTALTEFVVVMPIFIMLLFWAEFFVDFGIVKMKVEEASRFALWEKVAQRSEGQIQTDVRTRFSDLSSPSSVHNSAPVGARSFKSLIVSHVSVPDNLAAPFAGSISMGNNGGGVLGALMATVYGFLGQALDGLVRQMQLETRRAAQATVEFQVQNTLFPGGRLLTGFFDPDRATFLTVRGTSPQMLVDTWKAWPGIYSLSSQSVETDPYNTYSRGSASAPEVEVSARMRNASFLGQGRRGIFNSLDRIFRMVGLDPFVPYRNWKDKSGPIVMLPGDAANQQFSPAKGAALQRWGDTAVNSAALTSVGDIARGTDRARSTVPSSTLHTGLWTAEGGMSDGAGNMVSKVAPVRTFPAQQNGYPVMYSCRSSFYMGAAVPSVQRWGVSNPNKTAFPNCQ